MQNDCLWGIDLGGTKIEGIVLGRGGAKDVLFRDRIPTESEHGYEHIIKQIQSLVSIMEIKVGFRPQRIGMGTPGTHDPRLGTMKGCNTECLNGKALKDDLTKALGVEVIIANDANCFALAETRLGVVKQKFPTARVVFGVIIGTGVGGGLVVNGQVIQGLHGIGGEWGHNFLDESGGACFCGKVGCVEKVLSGPALEKYYFDRTGKKKALKEIHSLAGHGDADAQATLDRLMHFFGKAISVVINLVDPDVIVIGGGVGLIPEIYTVGRDRISQHIFNRGVVDTPIVTPILGDSAGVFGAAYLMA